MKKIFPKLGITVPAFIFGITVTALWFYFNPNLEQYDEVDFSRIPTVKQCDLRNNPRKLDGKIVRFQGKLYWYQHGYFFEDYDCIGEEASKSEGETWRTAVLFHKSKSEEIYQKIEKFHVPYKRWQPVNITAIGRFTYKTFIGESDHIQERTHLQFEIYEIESIEK